MHGDIMFIMKKIISGMLMPVPFILELLVAGLIILWFTKRQIAAKIIITLATFLLLTAGFGIATDNILYRLENMYPPLEIKAAGQEKFSWVVVLASGHISDSTLPVTSQLDSYTQVRLNEGIRLHRKLPGSKLLLSGGAFVDPVPCAELMAELARDLGVDPGDIVLETRSKDTEDEAEFIRPMVGDDRFILVTTASHVPRAMALFEEHGMHPVPAPVGHAVIGTGRSGPWSFFPGAVSIHNCELMAHEVLGLLSIEIRQAIQD
ncbi:hypothetical protein EG829_27400 [bacterium]|nr:hypothetical protein [bacterium]